MLQQAGLATFIDPHGFVSDHDAGGIAKPRRAIYEFAARQVGVAIDRCLFIGENLAESSALLPPGCTPCSNLRRTDRSRARSLRSC
jgi:FMN phosphatase YigB (HAD superfamily)